MTVQGPVKKQQPDGMSHGGGGGGSTDLKMVVWVDGFCGCQRRRRFVFRHMAGGELLFS